VPVGMSVCLLWQLTVAFLSPNELLMREGTVVEWW